MKSVRFVLTFAVLAGTLAWTQTNPVPFIDQPLVPTAVAPGGQGFTLTVNGANFVSNSVVQWNGTALPTTFVSGAQLAAVVPASDVAKASTASVTVFNPVPGGGTSNVAFFEITNPLPSIQLATKGNGSNNVLGEAVADFNGDGNLDIALATVSPDQATILLGKGDGTFQAPVSYPVLYSSGIASVLVGDFNRDGKLDLVVGLSLLLGNGDGTFQPAVSLASVFPQGLIEALGDFNRDGNLDLAGAAPVPQITNDIVVALGNGDGTFQTAMTVATCGDAQNPIQQMIAADFNNDGNLDLAAAEYDTGICVDLGNGDGTFTQFGGVPHSSQLAAFAVSDFNNDGKQDVLYNGGGGLALALGNGDGTFQNPLYLQQGNCGGPDIIPGDFAGDRKLGFAFGSCLFLGNGDGTFQVPISYPIPPVGFTAAGDFEGDGTLDLLSSWTRVNLQVVQPLVTTSPSSLDFGAVMFGKTSNPQAVTLSNPGNTSLQITSIGFTGTNSGEFSQTNTCGSSLAATAQCQINVTFSPAAGGNAAASLSITDNASGSPQLVAVQGVGQDFSLSASPNTLTTVPGQVANYTVTVSPLSGFNQIVTLNCSGAPAQSTCTLTPSSVAVDGIHNATANVAVITQAATTAMAHRESAGPRGYRFAVWLLFAGALGLTSLTSSGRRRRSSSFGRWLLVFFLLSLIVVMPACGGGGSAGANESSGTTTGTYKIVVTGTYTAGGDQLSHSVQMTLVVQ